VDAAARREQKRLAAQAREQAAKERRELRAHVRTLEEEIARLEAREKELVAALEDPASYAPGGPAMQLNRELAGLHDRLPALHADWEAAATRLAAQETD